MVHRCPFRVGNDSVNVILLSGASAGGAGFGDHVPAGVPRILHNRQELVPGMCVRFRLLWLGEWGQDLTGEWGLTIVSIQRGWLRGSRHRGKECQKQKTQE